MSIHRTKQDCPSCTSKCIYYRPEVRRGEYWGFGILLLQYLSPYSTGNCMGLRWLPHANEINTKQMKCTWPTPDFCVGTQCNLYSTGLRLGFESGKTQLLGFASGDAKVLSFALGDAKVPNASSFASQWNIGFNPLSTHTNYCITIALRASVSMTD